MADRLPNRLCGLQRFHQIVNLTNCERKERNERRRNRMNTVKKSRLKRYLRFPAKSTRRALSEPSWPAGKVKIIRSKNRQINQPSGSKDFDDRAPKQVPKNSTGFQISGSSRNPRVARGRMCTNHLVTSLTRTCLLPMPTCCQTVPI